MVIRDTKNEGKKKYNYVYKLYFKLDERYYYIGKRSTNDEDDSNYLGSGKLLKKYKEKYGKDCFKKEILSYWNSSEEALKEEARLVTKEVVDDEFCLNRMVGGGAFDTLGCKWGNRTPEQIEKVSKKLIGKKQSKKTIEKRSKSMKIKWEDESYRKKQIKSREGKYDEHLKKLSKERNGKICIIKNGHWKYIEINDYERYKLEGWKKRGVENKPTLEEIEKYRKEGLSFSKIGSIYNVNESCVRKWMKKYLNDKQLK